MQTSLRDETSDFRFRGDARPRAKAVLAYVILGTIAGLAVYAHGDDPFRTTPAFVGLERPLAIPLSIGLGLLASVATIAYTRGFAMRSERARALVDSLRPSVVDASTRTLVVMALLSGVAEEIIFRGALVPWVGIVPSAVAFGLLHQVRGKARWYWATWAFVMGLAFGAIFRVTGELAGAIVLHVVVNAHNLLFVRDGEPVYDDRRDPRGDDPHGDGRQ
ncbi:MAG: CPBP family intramembrane glutamic endopeptidase [Polyangiaceae bacterium]